MTAGTDSVIVTSHLTLVPDLALATAAQVPVVVRHHL